MLETIYLVYDATELRKDKKITYFDFQLDSKGFSRKFTIKTSHHYSSLKTYDKKSVLPSVMYLLCRHIGEVKRIIVNTPCIERIQSYWRCITYRCRYMLYRTMTNILEMCNVLL